MNFLSTMPAEHNQPATQIDSRAVVAANVTIGVGCVIASGAVLSAGTVLGRHVSIGPNVVFVESMVGRSERAACAEDAVQIGANATIYPGLTLAAGSIVSPGAVVTKSVPAKAIVEGNPATIVGYVDANRESLQAPSHVGKPNTATFATAVRGVTVHTFPIVPDLRGNLTVGEFAKDIPFSPKRYFMVFGVPSREVRGEHAHHVCHQFLICVRGSCAVVADDGDRRIEINLDAPNRGVYLPPMTWATQYKYSADALLLVFASHHYDAADYIRDYHDFRSITSIGKS